jgi:hypothetical protein
MVQCAPVQRFFHELLHQFHKLRDMERHDREKNTFASKHLTTEECLTSQFYGVEPSKVSTKTISSLPWANWKNGTIFGGVIEVCAKFCNASADSLLSQTLCNILLGLGETMCLKVEEVRTILGSCREFNRYLEGDDLSENLFLRSLKLPLRFGHGKLPFIEEEEVLKRAKDVTDIIRLYSNGTLPDIRLATGGISPSGNNFMPFGLRGFRISSEDCLKKLKKDNTKTEWDTDE